MKTIYTAKATAIAGRAGHAETDDKKISIDLSPPDGNGAGSNPEQLFACGYAACFGGAVEYLAKQKKLDVAPVTVKSEVSLNQVEGGFAISAAMDVLLPSLSPEDAAALVKEAHAFCPYSKATRGNIDVRLSVNGQVLA